MAGGTGIVAQVSGTTIAIVGVGAIGGAVAAALADLDQHELVLCARSPFDVLEVQHPSGTSRVAAPVLTDSATALPVNWVLVATKAHQTSAALPWLRSLTGRGTRWAMLQNGVDHVERAEALCAGGLRPAGIVPVVVNLPAERVAPGRIVQSLDGMLTSPDDVDGREFAELFDGARIRVRPHADFVTIAWRKLVMNASLGGVCAFLSRENGSVAEGALRTLVLDVMWEVVAVAKAEGASLEAADCAPILDAVLEVAGDHWSSISLDRREGRPMEWEARNAVVGRRGRAHGIATPFNDAVTALLRGIDRQREASAR